MRVQRWVLGMSLTLLAISLVGLLVLPCIYVDEGSRASLLGLLTGMASGSLLAVVSTACGLRIAVSRSKRRLEYLCATLVSNLYGADLIFSKIGNGALPLRIITYAFDCLTGSGIACANAMCAEVDEDLFIMKKKRGQLGELLSIASALGPRATRLSNRGADVLRLESEVQKLSFSEKASASDALGSLRNALEKSVQEICEEGKALSLEYENITNTAMAVVFDSERLASFEERVNKGKAEQDSAVESAERENAPRS